MRVGISANNEAKAQLAKLYFEVKIWLGLGSNAFVLLCVSAFFYGFHALFMRPTSTKFSKYNFKIGSHDIIHTFKNYFALVFSVFNF